MITHSAPLRTALVVASREVLEHSRTPLVWVLAIAGVCLTVLSTLLGAQRVEIATQRYGQLEDDRLVEFTRNAPLTGARLEPSLRVLRAPRPLGVLVEGQIGRPQYWDVGPAGVRTGADVAFDQAYAPGAPSLDLEAVIRIVIGLLAVLLAVESVSGERASGTLLALLGQPVSPGAIAAGKLLGATGTLALIIACCGFCALVTLASMSRAAVGTGLSLSLAAICLAGLGYTVTWLSLGMLISTVLPSYRLALTITFVSWSLSALVAPELALAIARLSTPVLTNSIVEAKHERLAQRATDAAQRRMGDVYAASLGGPAAWAARQEDAAANRVAQAQVEPIWHAHIAGLRRDLEDDRQAFERAEHRQRRLVRVILLGNPAGAFTSAASDLAAVGDGSIAHWKSAVSDYQAVLNTVLFDNRPAIMALVPYVSARAPSEERRLVVQFSQGPPRRPSDMPRFQPPEEGFRGRLGDAGAAVSALAAYAMGATALCVFAFKTRKFNLSRVEQ